MFYWRSIFRWRFTGFCTFKLYKGTLYTDSKTVKSLKDIKISAVNLAHNHIQDKGLDGISETVDHLKNVHIGTFGAGHNKLNEKKCHMLTDEIALLGYCEYGKKYLKQIVVSDDNTPGINPLRYDNIMDDLNSLSASCKAILYFHWEENMYN